MQRFMASFRNAKPAELVETDDSYSGQLTSHMVNNVIKSNPELSD